MQVREDSQKFTGRRFKLQADTVAIDFSDGKGVAVTLPEGAVIELASRSKERGPVIDVLWNGRALKMFVLDLDNCGIEVEVSGRIGNLIGVLVNEDNAIAASGVTLSMVTNTSGIMTVDHQPSFARDQKGKTFGFRGGYMNPGQKFEISILSDEGVIAVRPRDEWSRRTRRRCV